MANGIKRACYTGMCILIVTLLRSQSCDTTFLNTGTGYSGSLQYYTVPDGVTSIRITANGAQGGSGSAGPGGKGASISGTFEVIPGLQLKILVGQMGGTGPAEGGGGGGSFVTDMSDDPLIVAGGGGGSSSATVGKGGVVSTCGTNGDSSYGGNYGLGGCDGNGGDGTTNCSDAYSGGGLLTNGTGNCGEYSCFSGDLGEGQSFLNGGDGGYSPCDDPPAHGGYGGGGATDGYIIGGGGGGGYSGGGSGGNNVNTGGGGGGSYNAGTDQDNEGDVNEGHGSVTISTIMEEVSIFPAGSLCAYDTIIQLSGSPEGGIWSGPGVTDSLAGLFNPSLAGGGIHDIIYLFPGPCGNGDTLEIEVYLLPKVELGPDTAFCDGSSLVLDPGSGYSSYTWQDGSQDPVFEVTASGLYWVTVMNEQGCLITDSIDIEIHPTPLVNLGNDTTVCDNSTLVLDPGPFFTDYTWQDGSQNPTYEVNGPGLFWVLVENQFGCQGSDSIVVSFSPSPEISLGNDTLICEGDALVLDPGPGYTSYLWQDNSTEPTFTAMQSGTYWVTVFNQYACFSSDTVLILTAPWPSVDLGADSSFCAGEEFVLEAGEGYQAYLWQNGSTSPSLTATQTGWYWVTVSNACSVDTDSVFLVFYPAPEIDLGEDTTICSGEPLVLQPDGNYLSYAWQDGSSYPFFTVTSPGLYSVEVTSFQGCSADDEIYVEMASPVVELGDDSLLCEGGELVLDAGEGFADYLWQDGSGERWFTVLEGGNYSVTVTDPYNCQAIGSIEVMEVPELEVDLGEDQHFCKGESLVLHAPESPYFTYYWNGEMGNAEFTVTSEGYYTLSVVSPCDSLADEIFVAEIIIPGVDLGDDRLAFPGETVVLDAGWGYDSYLWQNGYSGQVLQVDEKQPVPDGMLYFVDVTLGICKSSDSVRIEFFNAWVPSVITPNGDGKNDLFRADPERWGAINNHHMTVYNRWGEKVWESEDFPGGWDGKKNGRPVADGTYFWILELYYGHENVKHMLKGNLFIIGSPE